MRARLLIVEDHADTRDVLKKILKAKGFDVMCAGSGGEALKLATEIRFDLVIMDHGLPDGNGCGFMRILNRIYGVEGIALTANAYESDKQLSREGGFRAHLNKPVNAERLCEVIDSCLPDRKEVPSAADSQIDGWCSPGTKE